MEKINKNALRELMMSKAINIKELADMSKVSPATTHKLVTRGGKVNFKTIGKISHALDVQPAQIIKDYV